jgi:hypothetical protein
MIVNDSETERHSDKPKDKRACLDFCSKAPDGRSIFKYNRSVFIFIDELRCLKVASKNSKIC